MTYPLGVRGRPGPTAVEPGQLAVAGIDTATAQLIADLATGAL